MGIVYRCWNHGSCTLHERVFMKPILLIGGPADGRRIHVDDDVDFVSIPIRSTSMEWYNPIMNKIEVGHYHIRELRGEKKSFHVGFCEWSLDDCIRNLLCGYKPV